MSTPGSLTTMKQFLLATTLLLGPVTALNDGTVPAMT
jgi:hypothetical protein